jgi:putative transposase
MKRSRFSEEQIVGVLKEAEAGVPVKDLCRRVGISEATFYHWKAKYGGLEVNETRRLRQLEEENGRLKKIVAQQALDLDALKVMLAKKSSPRVSPRDRRLPPCRSFPSPRRGKVRMCRNPGVLTYDWTKNGEQVNRPSHGRT